MSNPVHGPAMIGRIVLLCILVAVAACGGGGGGGGPATQAPAPEPPAAILSITASTTQTTAGGNDVDLTGTLQNSSNPIVWSLAGPGRLNAATGASIKYTPPASLDLLVPSTATVTASSRDLVRSLTIQLSPAPGAPPPVPGTRWDIAQYPKYRFTDLRLLNGRFFASNAIGGILNSTDGINWTPRATPLGSLNAITYGNDGYMAVGADTVLKSADGDVWVDAGAAAGFEFIDIAAGNGTYVAIGLGGMSTSADGAEWARVGPQDIGRGMGVAFGGGRFVAVDNSHRVHHSVDGSRWSTQTLPDMTTLNSVAYGNGRFVIAGEERNLVSTDGLTWAPVPVGVGSGYRVRFANGQFFMIARDKVWTSADGAQWREVYRHALVAIVVGMAESAGRYAVADDSGKLQQKGDAPGLSDALPGPSASLTSIVSVAGQFFAVSSQGDVLRSDDARVWTPSGNRLPAQLRGIAHGDGMFVAVSEGGPLALYTSSDGSRWSGVALDPPNVRLASTAHGNGVFVVAATTGEIFYSTDALRWTQTPSPVRVELGGVTHGSGRFVAVSVQGEIITSADGVQWTLQRNVSGRLRAVTFGTGGFVAVGDDSDGGSIWTSPDGLTWTQGQPGAIPSLSAATFGNGKYLVAGAQGALLLSDDGVLWQARTAGIHPGFLAACAAGGRFVAVGWGGAIVMSAQ